MKSTRTIWGVSLGVALGAVLVAGCSADDDGGVVPVGSAGGFTGGGLGSPNVGTPPFDGAAGGAPLPPEEEDQSAFRAPVVTGKFLWSANPESGRVALVNGETRSVRVLSAGLLPTYVAAVPGADPAAVVLNIGSDDASLFRVKDGTVQHTRFPTHARANRWSVSNSGRWAVAWSQADQDLLDATESLQEITVVDLGTDPPTPQRMTVGYRPSEVHIDSEDEQLTVVSEEGITVIDLTGPLDVTDWIPLEAVAGRDVSITADGHYALVRKAGDAGIQIVDVQGDTTSILLTLSGPVTDLDLSASGRAVAVVREDSLVTSFYVDEIVGDPSARESVQITGQLFGSVALAPTGERAVLFTNAVDNEDVTVLDLSEADFGTYRTFSTKSPVHSVSTSPDGGHAIALGRAVSGKGAFAVLSLTEERFPRVVGTDRPVEQVALGNRNALVTSSGQGVYEAHLVGLPELSVDAVRLASAPSAAGLLPQLTMGYVAQAHPEGRLTFFDFETAEARTVTGFELAAKVVDE